MNYKIRFYDIINGMALGFITIAITIYFVDFFTNFHIDYGQLFTFLMGTDKKNGIVFLLMVVFLCYIVGIIINSAVDFLSTLKIKPFTYIFKGSLENICKDTKYDLPSWIFLVENKNKTIKMINEQISLNKTSETITESKNFNDFFLGITFILCLLNIFLFSNIAFFYITHDNIGSYQVRVPETFYQMFNVTLSASNDGNIAQAGNEEKESDGSRVQSTATDKNDKKIINDNQFRYFNYLTFIRINIILWICFFFLARRLSIFYAIKYMTDLSACITPHNINIQDIFEKVGIPTAYVLMKIKADETPKKLCSALESIIIQEYKKIKLIIVVYGTTNTDKTKNLIAYVKNKLNCREDIEIIYCELKNDRRASASFETRKKFVDIASENDVAFLLGKTDIFFNKKSISIVMEKIAATDTNMCLLGFTSVNQVGYSLIADDKLIYNDLLKTIAKKQKSISQHASSYLYTAATMGWTKAYRRSLLRNYVEMIEETDKDIEERINNCPYQFSDLYKLSGFVDHLIFLFKDVKVSAVTENVHRYEESLHKSKKLLTINQPNDLVGAIQNYPFLKKLLAKTIYQKETDKSGCITQYPFHDRLKAFIYMFGCLNNKHIDNKKHFYLLIFILFKSNVIHKALSGNAETDKCFSASYILVSCLMLINIFYKNNMQKNIITILPYFMNINLNCIDNISDIFICNKKIDPDCVNSNFTLLSDDIKTVIKEYKCKILQKNEHSEETKELCRALVTSIEEVLNKHKSDQEKSNKEIFREILQEIRKNTCFENINNSNEKDYLLSFCFIYDLICIFNKHDVFIDTQNLINNLYTQTKQELRNEADKI